MLLGVEQLYGLMRSIYLNYLVSCHNKYHTQHIRGEHEIQLD
jgi:hypothetical protein